MMVTIGTIFKDEPDAVNVYIGRPGKGNPGSPLANPFPITDKVSRAESIETYEKYLKIELAQPSKAYTEMVRLMELVQSGQHVHLQCFCHGPKVKKRCHGEVIKAVLEKALKSYETRRPKPT